ncbi:MAG TPA: hypothetical protein VGO40_04590 [Longimicrobium sp.]|nr:hypothetical protein [Longimicrobium sp.]
MDPFTREAHSPGVLARDFVIFYIKLLVDGAKGLALVQVALFAFCLDLILMLAVGRKRSFFYRVLEIGERFDLWLNLYNPSKGAGHNPDGLFGESRAGDATFLGEMEELVRRGPEPPARPAGPAPAAAGLAPRR